MESEGDSTGERLGRMANQNARFPKTGSRRLNHPIGQIKAKVAMGIRPPT